jgi:hypothetical protein
MDFVLAYEIVVMEVGSMQRKIACEYARSIGMSQVIYGGLE